MNADEQVVERRCYVLAERELVVPVTRDSFEMTNLGLAYLRGDLDAGELPRYPGLRLS